MHEVTTYFIKGNISKSLLNIHLYGHWILSTLDKKKKENYVSLVLDDMHMHGITIYFYKKKYKKIIIEYTSLLT